MKRSGWIAAALVIAALATSCDSDRLCDPEANYPDIRGLVVFYQFDGDLRNAVGDAHHGSECGTVYYGPDHRGVVNSAVSVDRDTIRVASHSDLDITGAITIAAWIRPRVSEDSYVAVADKLFLRAYSFGLAGTIHPDTVPVMGVIAGQPFASRPVVPVGTGVWTHIAFTYEEERGEGKFYINGVPAGSQSHKRRIGKTTEDLRIGATRFGDAYRGAIDQLAVFDRALTPTEVRCLYAFE